MTARGGVTLFHVRGIRISADYSWFIVLLLVIVFLTGEFRDVLGVSSSDSEPYVLAVISAILFFGSILLHELGHAFVAIRNDIQIADITLWMFGGLARLKRDSDSPGVELRIALAGPAVTLLIAIACGAIGFAAGGEEFWEAMRGEPSPDASGPLALLAWIASINVLVLFFNLIPAFPLDGGRVVRAIAWRWSGSRNRGTRFAATVGQGFSYLFIGFGLFVALTMEGQVINGIWLALIGFIIGSSARSATVQTEITARIEHLRVADVMDAEPIAIPDDLSVERALDEFFLRYRWPWFPVVDPSQRFRGLLQRGAADAVPEGRRDAARVAEFVTADADGGLAVRDDAPLEAVLGNENLRRLGGLVAVDAEGHLRGVLTVDAVGRSLRPQ
ncbi:MAG TPA: site-2 protease family protein [Solirubrobacterales bacterium]